MSTTKLILIYGAVLLSLLLFILWFIDHSGLGIPEIFPGTTIQTYTASVSAHNTGVGILSKTPA